MESKMGCQKIGMKMDSNLMKEIFSEGQHHGESKSWHENGKLKGKQYYSNGTQIGACSHWYANGKKSKVHHLKNKQNHGLYTEWFPKRAEKSEVNWANGKVTGTAKFWHENGQQKELVKRGWMATSMGLQLFGLITDRKRENTTGKWR